MLRVGKSIYGTKVFLTAYVISVRMEWLSPNKIHRFCVRKDKEPTKICFFLDKIW